MKILISTGTFPPEIGGSSDYSAHLSSSLRDKNHSVLILTFGVLKKFPTGIRHLLYFIKLCMNAREVDYIIALDIFSVAFPTVIFAKLFKKKVVVRVGGDFLWESYVERTRQPILLSEFYSTNREYSLKEKIIFKIIGFVFQNASMIVFSTDWQRKIMDKPYGLNLEKTYIIENCYFPPIISKEKTRADFSQRKVFFSPSRNLFLKNKEAVRNACDQVRASHPEVVFDEKLVSHAEMLEKIKTSYAVVVASLSEVSPNLVLHSLEYDVPVIVTEDTGIKERLKDLAVFVNPLSVQSIQAGMETLLNPDIYDAYKRKIMQNTFTHSWSEIAEEFLSIYTKI